MKAVIFSSVIGSILTLLVGYSIGVLDGRREGREAADRFWKAQQNECICGEVRTCAFGVGITGYQECTTRGMMRNEWSRCEPDRRGP